MKNGNFWLKKFRWGYVFRLLRRSKIQVIIFHDIWPFGLPGDAKCPDPKVLTPYMDCIWPVEHAENKKKLKRVAAQFRF